VPGGIGGNMSQGNPNPVYTPARFIGDSLNNLLNVIIMISIVSGIIIDTFGSLREEENNKNSDIKDKCFMCGNEKYQLLYNILALFLRGNPMVVQEVFRTISG
jgi:inositol 1,4,5-triphosphate receptor type 1/inositol 1,4,5-triphosphate receptor type 3